MPAYILYKEVWKSNFNTVLLTQYLQIGLKTFYHFSKQLPEHSTQVCHHFIMPGFLEKKILFWLHNLCANSFVFSSRSIFFLFFPPNASLKMTWCKIREYAYMEDTPNTVSIIWFVWHNVTMICYAVYTSPEQIAMFWPDFRFQMVLKQKKICLYIPKRQWASIFYLTVLYGTSLIQQGRMLPLHTGFLSLMLEVVDQYLSPVKKNPSYPQYIQVI